MRRLRQALLAAAALALVSSSGASATLPQRSGSTVFDASANLQLLGTANDELGNPVYLGDVNGDGIGDWAVGDSNAVDPVSGLRTGAVFVIYGRPDVPPPLSAGSLGSAGFAIYGFQAGQLVGASVAAAGDVNGDGIRDIVLGAPGESGSGAAYVVYGSTTGGDVHLGSLSGHGFAIRNSGGHGGALGYSVAGAGDVNGDGYLDLVVGAPSYIAGGAGGAVYVVFGGPNQADVDVGQSSAAMTRMPDEPADLSPIVAADGSWEALVGSGGELIGASVAGVGDFNGDGHSDIAFTLRHSSSDPTGEVYVQFLVPESGQNPAFDSVFAFSGPAGSGSLASGSASLAAAGDFNGDGFADIVVGDPYGPSNRGAAYIVLGRPGFGGTEYTNYFTGYKITGTQDGETLGASVAGVANISGDSTDSGDPLAAVAIGAPGFNAPAGVGAGQVLVIYGVPGRLTPGTTATIDASTVSSGASGFAVYGAHAADRAGRAVGGGGDVSGDGRPDLLVAAPADVDGGTGAGAVAVVNGWGTPYVSYGLIKGQVGVPLHAPPLWLQHTGATSFTARPALPAGLTIDPVTGVISGTPTATGSDTYNIAMSDQSSATATTVSISIGPGPPRICPAGQIGTPPRCHPRPRPASCVVPKLRGMTLSVARHALQRAHCRIGRVRRLPRPRHVPLPRGARLVQLVWAQSPRARTVLPSGTQVSVTLAYKVIRPRTH